MRKADAEDAGGHRSRVAILDVRASIAVASPVVLPTLDFVGFVPPIDGESGEDLVGLDL